MRANRLVGSTTEYKHYLKIKQDIANGLVPEQILSGFKELEEKYIHVDYQPPSTLKKAWEIFFDLRNANFYENRISYQEILAYQELMCMDISPVEVRLIMLWDTLWYKYYNQYHNGK